MTRRSAGLSIVVVLALVVARAFGAGENPKLATLDVIPQPNGVTFTSASFDPKLAKFIIVSDETADRLAAEIVRHVIKVWLELDCELVTTPRAEHAAHQLRLATARDLPAPTAAPAGDESYSLTTDAAGVSIDAASEAGLFYGAQTLVQLLEQSRRDNAAIPGLKIEDAPTFKLRGRYYDASQYTGTIVNTRAGIEHEIELMGRYKLNTLIIELYNLVPFKSFPACADGYTLPAADWEYLVDFANQNHVTLVPSLQSLAQTYQVIWTCDQGKPYRESTAPGLICPSRPENVRFLQSLYKDLIAVFKYSPILGIGCSEVAMQWQGHLCPLCQKRVDAGETLSDIFVSHVRDCSLAVTAAAKELGRDVRPMMWADEFYMGYEGKFWQNIEKIPKNTLMGHWKYWADYNGIAGLLERGYDVFFLSATYQHNNFFIDLSPEDPPASDGKSEPLTTGGVRNVVDQARAAIDAQSKFPANKVLGGGCATFSQHDLRCWDTTWFAYALQAEYSWGSCKQTYDEIMPGFTRRFAATIYQPDSAAAVDTIATGLRQLDSAKSDLERNNYLIHDFIGLFDVQDVGLTDNTLAGSLALIKELAAHPKGEGKTVGEIRTLAARVVESMTETLPTTTTASSSVKNQPSFEALDLARRKISHQASRTLFLLDYSAAENSSDANVTNELGTRCTSLIETARGLESAVHPLTHANPLLPNTTDTSGYLKEIAELTELRDALTKALPTTQNAKPAQPATTQASVDDRSSLKRVVMLDADTASPSTQPATRPSTLPTVYNVRSEVNTGTLSTLSWDTEGGGRAQVNLLRQNAGVTLEAQVNGEWKRGQLMAAASQLDNVLNFDFAPEASASWEIGPVDAALRMRITLKGKQRDKITAVRLRFPFDPLVAATTVYPKTWNDDGTLTLPAIISAPDFGQLKLTTDIPNATALLNGSRAEHWVDFTVGIPMDARHVATLDFAPIYLPKPDNLEADVWRMARRGWWNAIEPAAQWGDQAARFSAPAGVLANNVLSDPVSCLIHLWADQILLTPKFDDDIQLAPLLRRTLDWWFDHRTKETGEVYAYWDHADMLDANASPLIAAWDYVEKTHDRDWATARIAKLELIADYLVKRDVDNDGLIESTHSGNAGTLIEPMRAGSAYDTINAGYKDAYCNALIYRAFCCMADLETQLGRADAADRYRKRAQKLKAVYAETLLNHETGWLMWWKSADGKTHDLASPMINALAIEYGLVDADMGKAILEKLWQKIDAVGFKRLDLGVPITLVPVPRADYLMGLAPGTVGAPAKDDGTDTFGQYLNGGCLVSDAGLFATANHIVGLHEQGDRVLSAMLTRQPKAVFPNGGSFQNGVVNQWPAGAEFFTWDGTTTGYEGHLTYSYAFLQGIFLRDPAYREKLFRPMLANANVGEQQ